MTFDTFNADYVRLLADGDSDTGEHFAAYFGRVLYLKLRVRLPYEQHIEDIRQETLLRVLDALRKGNRVKSPERFGSFVNGVCDNVIREFRRHNSHFDSWEGGALPEPIDPSADADSELVSDEARREVRRIFARLSSKDRKILQAIYLDEMAKAEVCRIFEVEPAYLRVLLYRAKERVSQSLLRQAATG